MYDTLEFIGFCIDESELVDKILSEDSLGYGHSDVANTDNGDFGGAIGGGRLRRAFDGFKKGLS